jgi:hypothetical protein
MKFIHYALSKKKEWIPGLFFVAGVIILLAVFSSGQVKELFQYNR